MQNLPPSMTVDSVWWQLHWFPWSKKKKIQKKEEEEVWNRRSAPQFQGRIEKISFYRVLFFVHFLHRSWKTPSFLITFWLGMTPLDANVKIKWKHRSVWAVFFFFFVLFLFFFFVFCPLPFLSFVFLSLHVTLSLSGESEIKS